ncbi:hypothetical protein SteCoe_18671 [Stentor coeruleus]|uniref:Kinetochore protein SPC25 n=1 Tax=Stentor coeruleus TaxID=5963 RepID=A0A1R2BVW8_9CILI|nr:hypothetical protein SteCoe_18671 [Stentor coeruleus]
MEKIKEDSVKLQKEILPQIENAVQQYISTINKLKNQQQAKFVQEIENIGEKIERIKVGIECDEAAISFIRSKIEEDVQNKENMQCPKQILYNSMQKYREIADKYSKKLMMYEKRLGLSLKKLNENTLWVSFHYLTPENNTENSSVIRVENGKYVLVSCTPELRNIQQLLETLNVNNDFSNFIKELRKSFKSLYV